MSICVFQLRGLVWASLFFIAANAGPLHAASPIQQQYERLDRLQDVYTQNDYVKGRQISAAYDQAFAPLQESTQLAAMDIEELRTLYRAAWQAAFYSYAPHYLSDMQLDLAAMQVRHAATLSEESELFLTLVQLRQLNAAHPFLVEHPQIRSAPLPGVRDVRASAAKPSALYVDPRKNVLTLRNVVLDPHTQIVVVGHPLCHFTQHAGLALEADPHLRRILRQHSVWISPQDGELDITDFQQWNREYPDLPLAIVWKKTEWPKIDDWETPTFYFFKDGVLVDKVVGWPKEGNLTALRSALQKAGLQE